MPEQVQTIEEFQKRANELLEKKYSDKAELPQQENKKYPGVSPQPNWEFIAKERLQMLNQMQTEMIEWQEAYRRERARVDELFSKVLGLEVNKTIERSETEIKHSVMSPEQLSHTRARWPQVKAMKEKYYVEQARLAHDAGLEKPETAKQEQES